MDSITSLFAPKPVGPDPAMLRAQAEQTRRLQEQEQREALAGQSRQRIVSATRSGPVTLFRRTGARGVTNSLGGA